MDIYRTRTLLRLIDMIRSRPSFLKDRYFPVDGQRSMFHTQQVLVEIKDNDRRLAPFVARNVPDVVMARGGEEMHSYTPPRLSPSRLLTLDDIEERGFGEALYTELTPEQRAANYITTDMEDLSDMIIRREETMAAEVLLTNACLMEGLADKVDLPVKDMIYFYDKETLGKNPAEITVDKKWNDPTADIIGALAQMILKLQKRGLPAQDFVCAPDVAMAVINNDGVYKQLDNRRYDVGHVAPTLEADGASIVCVLNILGRNINVIAYSETYTDDDGKDASYIPDGYGFLTAPACGTSYYGAVNQLESDKRFHTYSGARVPKVTADENTDIRKVRVQSKPILAPNNYCPSISGKFIGE